MIINALLWIVHGFLIFIAGLLSSYGNVTPNANIVDAVTTANGYIAAVRDFIPNGTILGVTVALLVFELLYAGYQLIRWAYQKIPGIT